MEGFNSAGFALPLPTRKNRRDRMEAPTGGFEEDIKAQIIHSPSSTAPVPIPAENKVSASQHRRMSYSGESC
ncbi:hypothetical protein DV515_00019230, partial [Chloebia gouldiae]